MTDFSEYRYDGGMVGEYLRMTEPTLDSKIHGLAESLHEGDFATAFPDDRMYSYITAKRALDWLNSQSDEKPHTQKWIPNGGLTGPFPGTTYIVNNATQ